MTRFAAAIISGGSATRMGFDKQLISVDGLALREYQISTLQLLFSEIIVVTNQPALYNHSVKCVNDILPFNCPLAGIHSALTNTSSDAVFVIACDMPMLDIDFIKNMIDEYLKETDVCVPEYDNYLEPLYAIYNTRCISSIEKYLSSGRRKISDYFEQINLIRFPASNHEMFINLNEPSDLTKLEVKNGVIVQKKS